MIATTNGNVESDLREAVTASGLKVKEIARRAGVHYDPLWRWLTGRQKTYCVVSAELVFHTLTGRTFTRCRCKPAGKRAR